MESNEISLHEVKFWLALVQNQNKWLSNSELGAASGVATRTARMYTLKLTRLGMLDAAEVFPSHRFRLSSKADKRNTAYSLRLKAAAEVFGLG